MNTPQAPAHRPAIVARLAETAKLSFGPLSDYQKLIGDDGGPLLVGVQTSLPGYQTRPHYHPYLECLFVLEGTMEAWVIGDEANTRVLRPGDMISLPAETPHAFRNPGQTVLRHLGIHDNPTRVVIWLDGP